ncbi:MAG: hypothetical protein JXA11_15455 [Phycisphaerae bacterium]|nr:hypothetical protein [Phycisphaerae bacterium]
MNRTVQLLLTAGMLISIGWADSPNPKSATEHKDQLRQTYREGFQPPAVADTEAEQMRELIEKINRTSLPKYRPTPKSARLSDDAAKSAAETAKPQADVQTAAPPSPPVLSAALLKELTQSLPKSVADPTQLGDALFRGGHRNQAMFVYQEAMKHADEPEDQAWLLYQMGCCLKDDNSAEARRYFQQVRSTLPDSPWSELASVQLQLVDWIDRNQPMQFLEDMQRDLREQHERIEESRQPQSRTSGEKDPSPRSELGADDGKTPTTQPVNLPTVSSAKPAETTTP